MRRILHARLLASALAAAVFPCVLTAFPAVAQDGYNDGVGFESFQQQLAPYGYWLYSDRWGVVWQPADVPDDFRPYYSAGRWVDTADYGWTWASDYQWGDIPFHYGRWVNDPDDGWLWLPGYTWSPGWVIWRTNDHFVGWMPMPPDEDFLGGRPEFSIGLSFGRGGISYGRVGFGDIGGFYGYSRWYGPSYNQNLFAANWVFVGAGHLADRDYSSYVVSGPQVINIIHQTRNVTNYTVINNYVVNKSVNTAMIERASGHPVPMVQASVVFRRPNLVTTVAVGQRAQAMHVAPRGMGVPHSAPPPSPAVVGRLSEHVAPRNGRPAPANLMTRAVVTSPAAAGRFGPARSGPPPMGGPGGGPNAVMKVQPPGPNDMTGRGGPPPHPVRPGAENPPGMGPGQGMAPAEPNPGSEPTRHAPPRPESGSAMPPPGSGPDSMGAPSGSSPPSEPVHHRPPRPESEPSNPPGTMTGPPGGENMPAGPPPVHHPHPETEPSGPPPGTMMGPSGNGPGSSMTPPVHHTHPPAEPGTENAPPPAHPPRAEPPHPPAENGNPPPPHKEKKPPPDNGQSPPQ